MAKTYEGIIQVGFPFEIQTNKPIDARESIQLKCPD